MSDAPSILIAGPGRLGTTLAVALARTGGYRVTLAGRDAAALARARRLTGDALETRPLDAPAERAALVLLAVVDGAIETVCGVLCERGAIGAGSRVLHVSGAGSSNLLARARRAGARVGSAHPLQTFPDPESGLAALPGSHWFVEGDADAVAEASRLAGALAGQVHVIETRHKVLYHAAAVFASNYIATLLAASLDCAGAAGIRPGDILPALMPLARASLENAGRHGPGPSLTGPVSRADADTISAHLEALSAHPRLDGLYRELASATVRLARDAGRIDDAQADRLQGLLAQPAT